MMKEFKAISKWGVLLLLGFFLGCETNNASKNQLRSAEAELRNMKSDRSLSKEKIDSLYQEIDRLQKQYLDLKLELNRSNQMLAESKRELSSLKGSYRVRQMDYARLEAWSDDLVDGYGPGIWLPSEHDWPLFHKRPSAVTVQGVINELNGSFGQHGIPTLALKKTEEQTVYVGVSDELHLTQGMGSFGARSYLQSVIFSLASLDDVDCVHFDFQEGDHAVPGKYCR